MPKKLKAPEELTFRYQIYPPSGNHKTFRIVKLEKGTGKSETIRTSETEKINEQLLNKLIKAEDAREKLAAIVERLYAKAGVKKVSSVVNPDNKAVLDEFWKAEYVPKLKELSDPDSARYEFERAIEALGNCSLRKSTKSELQRTIDRALDGNKQRRAVVKLNTLLKFLDRGFTLELAEREKSSIKYITLEDLPKLLEHLSDVEDVPAESIKTLHEVAFCTGVLIGESFALDPKSYTPDNDTIKIDKQVDKNGKRRETRVNERTTVVVPEGKRALTRWFYIKDKIPVSTRLKMSRHTKKAAMLAFKDKSKHITFADLRHSFAIHLLTKGVPINMVADCLGISVPSAKELYGHFNLSGSAISFISRTLKTS